MPFMSEKSSHYFDYDKFRDTVRSEKEIRQVTIAKISDAVGMHPSQLTGFLNGNSGTVGADFLASLLVWLDVKFDKFVVARRPVKKHVDTPEHRQVRVANAFLNRRGIVKDDKETAIEAMMRLIAIAEEKGLFDE